MGPTHGPHRLARSKPFGNSLLHKRSKSEVTGKSPLPGSCYRKTCHL
ncbi:hypothetical protein KVC_0108 [Ketogulonicigenium vulgare]|nr:hypothetical protein KVC_0108 [Ketogulonicigenium vulgare]